MTGSSTRQGSPMSLGRFALAIVRWLITNTKSAMISAMIGATIGFVSNVLLLGFWYDGFRKATIGSAVTGRGNLVTGSLFWAMSSTIVFSLFAYRRSVGRDKFWQQVRTFPATIGAILQNDSASRAHLLWGAAISLLATQYISPTLSAVVAVGLFAAAPSLLGRIVSGVLFRAWSALIQQLAPAKAHKLQGPLGVTVGIIGSSLAIAVGFFIPSATLRLFLALGCAFLAFTSGAQGPSGPKAALWLIAICFGALWHLLFPTGAFADDGGVWENGGILNWIRSGSFIPLLPFGFPGAIATAIGSTLGTAIGDVLGRFPGLGSDFPGLTGTSGVGGGKGTSTEKGAGSDEKNAVGSPGVKTGRGESQPGGGETAGSGTGVPGRSEAEDLPPAGGDATDEGDLPPADGSAVPSDGGGEPRGGSDLPPAESEPTGTTDGDEPSDYPPWGTDETDPQSEPSDAEDLPDAGDDPEDSEYPDPVDDGAFEPEDDDDGDDNPPAGSGESGDDDGEGDGEDDEEEYPDDEEPADDSEPATEDTSPGDDTDGDDEGEDDGESAGDKEDGEPDDPTAGTRTKPGDDSDKPESGDDDATRPPTPEEKAADDQGKKDKLHDIIKTLAGMDDIDKRNKLISMVKNAANVDENGIPQGPLDRIGALINSQLNPDEVPGIIQNIIDHSKDFASGVKDDINDLAKATGKAGKDVLDGLGQAATDIRNDPNLILDTLQVTKENVTKGIRKVGGDVAAVGEEIYNNPALIKDTLDITAENVGRGFGKVTKEAGDAVSDVRKNPGILGETLAGTIDDVQDPAKVEKAFRDGVPGGANLLDATDKSKPVTERLGKGLLGAAELAGAADGVQSAGEVIKAGGEKLIGKLTGEVVEGAAGGAGKIAASVEGAAGREAVEGGIAAGERKAIGKGASAGEGALAGEGAAAEAGGAGKAAAAGEKAAAGEAAGAGTTVADDAVSAGGKGGRADKPAGAGDAPDSLGPADDAAGAGGKSAKPDAEPVQTKGDTKQGVADDAAEGGGKTAKPDDTAAAKGDAPEGGKPDGETPAKEPGDKISGEETPVRKPSDETPEGQVRDPKDDQSARKPTDTGKTEVEAPAGRDRTPDEIAGDEEIDMGDKVLREKPELTAAGKRQPGVPDVDGDDLPIGETGIDNLSPARDRLDNVKKEIDKIEQMAKENPDDRGLQEAIAARQAAQKDLERQISSTVDGRIDRLRELAAEEKLIKQELMKPRLDPTDASRLRAELDDVKGRRPDLEKGLTPSEVDVGKQLPVRPIPPLDVTPPVNVKAPSVYEGLTAGEVQKIKDAVNNVPGLEGAAAFGSRTKPKSPLYANSDADVMIVVKEVTPDVIKAIDKVEKSLQGTSKIPVKVTYVDAATYEKNWSYLPKKELK